MAQSAAAAQPLSPHELLTMQLQKAINNPAAQRRQYAVLDRLPVDRPEDWAQILDELQDTNNVTLAYPDDGCVQVFWMVMKDD